MTGNVDKAGFAKELSKGLNDKHGVFEERVRSQLGKRGGTQEQLEKVRALSQTAIKEHGKMVEEVLESAKKPKDGQSYDVKEVQEYYQQVTQGEVKIISQIAQNLLKVNKDFQLEQVDHGLIGEDGLTILHRAAKKGEKLSLQKLIKKNGLNPNSEVDKKGRTILHIAVACGHLDLCKWLVDEQKMNLTQKDEDGEAVLHYTVRGGHKNVLEWLIKEKGLDPNKEVDKWGGTCLQVAAQLGFLDLCKWLVDEQKMDLAHKDKAGETVLHYALCGGHKNVMEWLIKDKGLDPNKEVDKKGMNPLHYAAQFGDLGLCKWLVGHHKMDLSQKDEDGEAVLHHAVRSGEKNVMEWLIKVKGIDPNKEVDKCGTSCLQLAAQLGHLGLCKSLVEESKQCLAHRDDDGETVLHYALSGRHKNVMEWLITEMNLDPNKEVDKEGRTILHFAAGFGYLSLCKWLVDVQKMHLSLKDNCGRAALHHAAVRGHENVVDWLIKEKGMDPNKEVDNMGRTCLHWAALSDQLDLFNWLVEEGNMGLAQRDKKEKTATHYLGVGGDKNLIQMLQRLKPRTETVNRLKLRTTPKREGCVVQ